MSSVTYQTRVPSTLISFCEAMSGLMSRIERNLYRDLSAGRSRTELKREYQKLYKINARQFNGAYAVISGKIASRKECLQRQIDNRISTIKGLEKVVKTWQKLLKDTAPGAKVKKTSCPRRKDLWACCPLFYGERTPRQQLAFRLHQKKRRLAALKNKLERLKISKPSLIFGGHKLWNAQYNLEANGYSSHKDWLNDWQASRNSQFTFVGSKDETAGFQICQLTVSGSIKIRVPEALESQFGTYVAADGLNFSYGAEDIRYALENNQALTYRFVHKNENWYVFVTVDRLEVPLQTHRRNGAIGVDLNPGKIGWSYCNAEGNLKSHGQFPVNFQDRSNKQIEAALGDVCAQLVLLAETWQCPIVIEKLDFGRKKASLREKGWRYARMLSNFAYSKFDSMLTSRCESYGIQLLHVNPAYSSRIGLVKYLKMYGLSSDTAAALVLARRALRHSERVQALYASDLTVNRSKHVWSFWRTLGRVLPQRRHEFYHFRVANSESVVNLLVESVTAEGISGKPKGTSDCERDSHARIVDATVPST